MDAVMTSGAAAVLRVVREIEAGGTKFSGTRRQRVLESAARAAAASGMALCHIASDGRVGIDCLAGALPDPELLDAAKLVFTPAKRRWQSAALRLAGAHAVVAGRATHFVVIVLDASPAAWIE